MNSGAPPKYIFYVEADSRETLEAAVEYIMRRLEGGGICEAEAEWDGERLTVKSCAEHVVYAVAKSLVTAYTWLGGKSIQVVRL